ncbi:hypothetical protein [Deinococcus arenae]
MGSFPGVILGATVVTLLNLRVLPSLGEATANLGIPQQVNPGQLLVVAGLAWWTVPEREPGSVIQSAEPFTPDRVTWHLASELTLARIVTVGVGLQLAPLLLTRGSSAGEAAALTGLLGLSALPGRVLFVLALRWVGPVPLTITLMGLLAAGAGFLLTGSSSGDKAHRLC